jgi:anaerobic magnesium-protoporphyrin IX monomethyl ester cyclase
MAKPVLLVNPGQDKPWASILPPMNLGYLASYLEKHGVEVSIIDELAGQDVQEALERLQPDIVGITATTALADDAYRVAKLAREYGMTTVMGGVHASFLTEEALEHVDMVVQGEGEQALLDISRGNRSKVIKTPYIKHLDDIPAPAWHLMDMEFYLTANKRMRRTHIDFVPSETRIGSLMTVRGCPYSCIFCCNSWRDTPVRFHTPERVIEDIRLLIERYQIQALYFAEDDFFINKKRVQKICRAMIDNQFSLRWSCQGRANSVDVESLTIAKEAGCQQIQFGFESGSQRILDILKNHTTTVEQNARAAQLCRQVGIASFATFILGNPTETIEDLEATAEFIKHTAIDRVGVLITTPFPGTKLWEWCEEHHLIPEQVDYAKLMTSEISIPACDTIPPQVINTFAQKIRTRVSPVTFTEIWKAIRSHPLLLYKSIRHPLKTLKVLIEMGYRLKTYLLTQIRRRMTA